jgi:hypothetical protein
MFERLADFLDIVVFGFVLIILASLQLRHPSCAEGILAVAALIFGIGLLLAKKWGLIGAYITLLLGIAVYFAQIWFEPIMTGHAGYIRDNILKMIVAILLLMYIGRTRIEQRFS